MVGKVKFYNSSRGFGFLTTSDGEYFFHCSSLLNIDATDVKEGQDVEFELGTGRKNDEVAIKIKAL